MLWESSNNSMGWSTLKGPKNSERTSWVLNSESVQSFCCGENKTKQNKTKSWRRSCSPSELPQVILLGAYKRCPCCSLPNWRRKHKHSLMKTSLLLDKMSVRESYWPSEDPVKVHRAYQSQSFMPPCKDSSCFRNFLHPVSLPFHTFSWVGDEMSKYIRKHRSVLWGRTEVKLVYFPK